MYRFLSIIHYLSSTIRGRSVAMKQLGILLVLVLGCALAIAPLSQAYYFEDEPTIESVNSGESNGSESNGEISSGVEPVNIGGDSASPLRPPTTSPSPIVGEEGSENEGKFDTEKRNLGMPSILGGNRQSNDQQQQQSMQQQMEQQVSISSPINDPMNPPATQSEVTIQQQQQPLVAPPNSEQQQTQDGNTARGMLSDIMGAIKPQDAQIEQIQASQQEMQQQQQQRQSASQVPTENLPVIYEKDRQVGPQPAQSSGSDQQVAAQQPAQQQQQSPIVQQQQQQQPPQQGVPIGLPQGQQSPPTLPQSPAPGNPLTAPSLGQPIDPNKPGSTARTFDSWTNCVGASSGKYGTCKNDVECGKSKGRSDGSCMGGFGVCCVMALTCGDKSIENNTFFANPDFPEASWEARLCEVEIKKKHKNILQIMIEFEEFELAPPNHEGECITDVFQVKMGSNRPSPYSLLRICGQNTGQHMYLDVSQIEEPLVLSLATSGGGYPRRWSIRIVQMDEKNHLMAPPGCLQYYTDTVGHFRSFNLGKNLRNLYYAICFRIDNGYSGIRFTSNFFGMNGPQCRRRMPGPPGIGGPGGHHRPHNGSIIEAHPHHLVIPPPGYAPPPPRPKMYPHQQLPPQQYPYQHQPQQQSYSYPIQVLEPQAYQGLPPMADQHHQQHRYKRMAYAEPNERVARTHHDFHHNKHHEKEKFEEKEFKHEHHEHHEPHHQQPYPMPPPQPYGGGGGYGQQASYGPPGPPPPYYQGHQPYGSYPQHYEHHKQHPYQHHESKKEEMKESKWGWTGVDPFGWNKKDSKMEFKHEKMEDKFEHKHGYDRPYPQHYQSGYGGYQHQGGYGPQPYGYEGGYGPQYHHKEIDKFGKKYEHLEYKHEKNHKGKESKDEKEASKWWPSMWGKKEEKKDKKEKYFQHHEALFPMMHIPEMPHCEPRFCGAHDVITFPPSGDSIAEMCGNRFNRGRGPKIISGSPLVVYVSNRGASRGSGFDMNYEQVFYIPKPYK